MCESRSYVKRTTDGGASWGAQPVWTADGDLATLAGRGNTVDLVWRDNQGYARYVRSVDGGASFTGHIRLSKTVLRADSLSVARGAGGLVAVSWLEQSTYHVSVRVSDNGGASFGPASHWPDSGDGTVDVAIGGGVVYLTYFASSGNIVVRRSHDAGATWSKATTVSSDSYSYDPVVVADAHGAYFAFTTAHAGRGQISYRRTTNAGMSWTTTAPLSPTTWSSMNLSMTLDGGTLRAAFWRSSGGGGQVEYTESADGVNWTTPLAALPKNKCNGFGPILSYADRGFLVCDDEINVYSVSSS